MKREDLIFIVILSGAKDLSCLEFNLQVGKNMLKGLSI